MPLYIKDEVTTQLVNELAKRRGTTKQEAVKRAVQADLNSDPAPLSTLEKLKKLWAKYPLPPPTGRISDKAFFDDLSGEP